MLCFLFNRIKPNFSKDGDKGLTYDSYYVCRTKLTHYWSIAGQHLVLTNSLIMICYFQMSLK